VATDLISDTMTLGAPSAVIFVTALLLVAVMVAKETLTAVPDRRGGAAGRIVDVALVPLLIVFATILAVRVLPGVR
jgi:hypothetical protein